MIIRTVKEKAISALMVGAIMACSAVFALAADTKVSGEIVVNGSKDAIVTVNGEAAKSGRTVFTASTIKTPANASAVVNVKNVGKVKIAPNTSMKVDFTSEGITGNIEKGRLTVLSSKDAVKITAPNGKVASLVKGDSVVTVQDDDDDDDSSSSSWLLWFVVFGGAAAAIAIAAASDNNRVDLGGGTTVVSPNV